VASIIQVGKRWRAQVRKYGVSKAQTFDSKKAAEQWASNLEKRIGAIHCTEDGGRSSLDALPGSKEQKARERSRWYGMMARCYNPEHVAYKHYGGRGIDVCERWHTFVNFYADMGLPPDGASLDRVDNERGYSPENCRWATNQQQALNRRDIAKMTDEQRSKAFAMRWQAHATESGLLKDFAEFVKRKGGADGKHCSDR